MLNPTVIYEDADVLVLDKPAGLIVHGDGRTDEATLSDWILEHYPALKDVGEPFISFATPKLAPIPRPGIVHRLDRDTSGVIVVAKTSASFDYLKTQFKKREMDKEYRAICYGHIPTDSGVIDSPIGKSKKDFRLRDASPEAGGAIREAKTVYEVLERLTDKAGHKYSYMRLVPKTGRTHQLRAHMRTIGYPIVCDSLYAHGRLCPGGLLRQGLHALSITFTMPSGGEQRFEAPLPADFVGALEELRSI